MVEGVLSEEPQEAAGGWPVRAKRHNRNGLQWWDTLREYGPPKTRYNRLPVRPRYKSVSFAANRKILVSAGEAIK